MITRLAKLRYVRIAGLAVGAVMVAGSAVLITASAAGLSIGFHPSSSSQQPGASDTTASRDQASNPSAVCSDFVTHFSSDLGKSQSDVNSAISKAMQQTLADEVKNGTLTQAQAQKIQQSGAGQPLCTLAARLGQRKSPAAGGELAAYKQQLLQAAAFALGISQTQLQSDLASGKSLSQIAAAQNPPVTEAQFRTRLIAQLKTQLDTAVTAGKLTSTQEQAILQHLQTGPIPFWDTPMHRPKPAAPPSPTAT